MTAYLAFYGEVWNCLTEEHRHEVGEDTDSCPNCELGKLGAKMTEFERMAFDWHFENVNTFAIECGLVQDSFRRLKLNDTARRIFLLAQEQIRVMFSRIATEQARKQAELERKIG